MGRQCDLTARGFAGRHSDQTFPCLSPFGRLLLTKFGASDAEQVLATVRRLAEGVHATLFFDFDPRFIEQHFATHK